MSNAVRNISKLNSQVYPEDFGAVGDGVVDDTSAMQAALNSFGATGGVVLLSPKKRYRVVSTLNLPSNTSIKGSHVFAGSPKSNLIAPYGSVGSAILLASAATITPQGGNGFSGILFHRDGMTFPAANSSAFAGTCITLSGDDVSVLGCQFLGFSTAITGTGIQRPNLFNLAIDCVNGISITNCADIARVDSVHCWPYATIAALGPFSSLQRSGTAFRFQTLGDWNKVTNCFAYGYFRGYWNTSCNSMTYSSCSADSTTGFAGQIGWIVDGGSTDTRLVFCQAAGQDTGLLVDATALPGLPTRLYGMDFWFNASHSVLIQAGDVFITGGINRDTANGVSLTSTTSRVFADQIKFLNIAGRAFNSTVSTSNVYIGPLMDFSGSTSQQTTPNLALRTVTSAAAISVDASDRSVNLTGTTGCGTLNHGWVGRKLTIICTGAGAPIYSSTGTIGAMRLAGGVTYNMITGSTLSLEHNGAQWYETGRSV